MRKHPKTARLLGRQDDGEASVRRQQTVDRIEQIDEGDAKCWELQDQYMFGDRYLVAPVFHLNEFTREVYLPAGRWKDTRDGKEYEGGCTVLADAPLDSMPVFEKL